MSSDYNQINSITLRRVAVQIDAPALTWHRAFWIRDLYERKNCVSIRENARLNAPQRFYVRHELDEAISKYLKTLREERIDVKDVALEPVSDDGSRFYLFSKAVRTSDLKVLASGDLDETEMAAVESEGRIVDISFKMRNIQIVVRIELRSEYFTIATFAKFSDKRPNIKAAVDVWSNITFGLYGDGARFSDMYDKLIRFLSESLDDEASKKQGEIIHTYFHSVFWRQFLSKEKRSEIFGGEIFKNMFADFRGMLLSNETLSNNEAYHPMCSVKEFDNSEWVYKLDKKLTKLLDETDLHETTASAILNGRGIYMSTLGAKSKDRADSNKIPIEYILFLQKGDSCDRRIKPGLSGFEPDKSVRGVNQFELGRFIDRLHISGTMRLAALKYFDALLAVGASLSSFDPAVQKARDAIGRENSKEMSEWIKDAHKKFLDITADFNKKTNTTSGVTYRIERARYYMNQFNKNMPGLHLTTLHGYQRYDHFVERHLGPTFDFIDRLGHRYERGMRSLSSLDQYNISVKTNETANLTEKTEERIGIMQEAAEAALIAFLIPYYGLGVLSYFISETIMPYLTICLWTIAACIAAWRYLGKKHGAIVVRIPIIIMACILAIGWVFGLVGLEFFHLPRVSQEVMLEQQNELLSEQKQPLNDLVEVQQNFARKHVFDEDVLVRILNVEREKKRLPSEFFIHQFNGMKAEKRENGAKHDHR